MSKRDLYMTCVKTFLTVVFAVASISFSTPADNKDGIKFFKGTFAEALAKAKIENKPIFLDVYASWCGPCKMLKRKSFKNDEVGAYFNKNFINITIDGESEEGRAILYKYQVTSYPTLLIVDHNGRKLTKAEGFMEPYILINFGRRIVP